MRAKIIKSDADRIVVVYWDGESGVESTAISISVEDLPENANNDSVFELADDVIQSGILYGITGDELAAMLPINYMASQLKRKNIWTVEDMKDNKSLTTRVISAAVHNMLEAL